MELPHFCGDHDPLSPTYTNGLEICMIFKNFFFACQDLLDESASSPTFKNDVTCLNLPLIYTIIIFF